MNFSSLFAVLLAASIAAPLVRADDKHHPSSVYDGEVRKVDREAKKITLKHGPLEKLDMPAMTMVFQVSDPALLDKVTAGDKVKFEAEKVGGAFTVTKIEAAR